MPKVTTIAPDLTTQAADKGGRIVLKVGKVALVGLEGSNPERRITRITRALRKGGDEGKALADAAKVTILKSAPKTAHNVRGMTGAEIAEDVFGLTLG